MEAYRIPDTYTLNDVYLAYLIVDVPEYFLNVNNLTANLIMSFRGDIQNYKEWNEK